MVSRREVNYVSGPFTSCPFCSLIGDFLRWGDDGPGFAEASAAPEASSWSATPKRHGY